MKELVSQFDVHLQNRNTTSIKQFLTYAFQSKNEQKWIHFVLLKRAMKAMNENILSDSVSTSVISCILHEMDDGLAKKYVVKMISTIVSDLGNTQNSFKAFGLLPKCLSVLAHVEDIPCSSLGLEDMTASEYQDYVVMTILQARWASTLLLPVLIALRETPLLPDQLQKLVSQLARHLPHVEQDQLPAVVYQCFLLSQQGEKASILRMLVHHLDSLSKNPQLTSPEAKQQVNIIQGTVILHFNFAAKQDPSICEHLLKLVKTRQLELEPFCVACLLSVARIQRHQKKVLKTLKDAVLLYLRWRDKEHTSPYLLNMLNRSGPLLVHLWRSLMTTVQNTGNGWDLIVPSLILLGFELITTKGFSTNTSGKKGSKRHLDQVLSMVDFDLNSKLISPSLNAIRLGGAILIAVFTRHKTVRKGVLDELLYKIMTGLILSLILLCVLFFKMFLLHYLTVVCFIANR